MQHDFPEIENTTRFTNLFQDDKTLLQYEEYSHCLAYEHIHINRKEITKGLKTNTIGKNIKHPGFLYAITADRVVNFKDAKNIFVPASKFLVI